MGMRGAGGRAGDDAPDGAAIVGGGVEGADSSGALPCTDASILGGENVGGKGALGSTVFVFDGSGESGKFIVTSEFA